MTDQPTPTPNHQEVSQATERVAQLWFRLATEIKPNLTSATWPWPAPDGRVVVVTVKFKESEENQP